METRYRTAGDGENQQGEEGAGEDRPGAGDRGEMMAEQYPFSVEGRWRQCNERLRICRGMPMES